MEVSSGRFWYNFIFHIYFSNGKTIWLISSKRFRRRSTLAKQEYSNPIFLQYHTAPVGVPTVYTCMVGINHDHGEEKGD